MKEQKLLSVEKWAEIYGDKKKDIDSLHKDFFNKTINDKKNETPVFIGKCSIPKTKFINLSAETILPQLQYVISELNKEPEALE